jgi:hypothetical protein
MKLDPFAVSSQAPAEIDAKRRAIARRFMYLR